ncbi:polycystin cation channel protein [Chloropicon primus]|nr:polycystin cation channel protein [Chloropicon primus]
MSMEENVKGALRNKEFRAFITYVIFVILFSVVTFISKPSSVQYEINTMHSNTFSPGEGDESDTLDKVYSLLQGHYADTLFPQQNADGNYMSQIDRLFLSGRGRILSAPRLRQVRSKLANCEVPSYLKEVYNQEIFCAQDYSSDTKETIPIHIPGSNAYIGLQNFTRPFEYQSIDKLNTTKLYKVSGKYGRYSQDGFALDVLPNLTPNHFAQELERCSSVVIQSLKACVDKFDVPADVVPVAPVAPPPPPPPPPMTSVDSPVLLLAEVTGGVAGDNTFSINKAFEITDASDTHTFSFRLINNGAVSSNWEIDQASLAKFGVVPDWLQIGTSSGAITPNDFSQQQINIVSGAFFSTAAEGQATMDPRSPIEVVYKDKAFPNVKATVTFSLIYNKASTAPAPAPSSRRLMSNKYGDGHGTYNLRKLLQAQNDPLEGCVNIPHANIKAEIPSGLQEHLPKCQMVRDTTNQCRLPYVSLQMFLKFMDESKCGNCACSSQIDSTCNQKCSAKELYLDQVGDLQKNAWIDDKTRAVIYDFSLLNAETNLVSNVRYMVEFPSFGLVHESVQIDTFKIFIYFGTTGMVILVLQMAFVAFIVWYTLLEILEIKAGGWAYFKDPWNYLDWLNLIILYCVIGLKLSTYLILSRFDFEALNINYIDFPPIGWFAVSELNVSAVNFFLLYFKIFKFMTEVPRMNSIIGTVTRCVTDIFFFMVMACIVIFGFTAAFYVCFGMQLAEFKTLGDSFGALMRLLLGDFDYQAMADTNSIMAPLLFYLFVTFVFMILLNMFLAIITDAYAEVKEEETEEDLHFYSNLAKQAGNMLSKLVGQKNKVSQLVSDLKLSDKNQDDLVDIEELKEALKDYPKALLLLETEGPMELLAKYDVNADGVLDKAEMTTILKQLAKKEAEISAEIEKTEEEELSYRAKSLNLGGGPAVANVDLTKVENRIDLVDQQVKELSRSMTKKLSLMVDLLMSLSDQVSTQGGTPQPPAPFQLTQGGPGRRL